MFGFEIEDPFAAAIARTREEILEKDFQEFRSTGIVQLTQRLTQNDPTLTHLDLSKKQFDRIGRELFYDLMDAMGKNTTVTHLNLRDSRLVYTAGGLRYWEKFCEMLRDNISITHLDLSENELYFSSIGDWELFLDALQGKKGKLLSLNLSRNRLEKYEMPYWAAFKKALQGNTELRRIDLSRNSLGEAGARFAVICETIASLPKLTHLNLNRCSMGELPKREWTQFCSLLENRPNITEIDLENNNLSLLGRSELGHFESVSNNEFWNLFCKIVSKNQNITTLKISQSDLVDKSKIWKQFCEAVSEGHSIYSLGSFSTPDLTKLMQTHKEDRHRSTLTGVHFLRHGKLPKNKMFERLPEVLVKKILSYLNIPDLLMTQVDFEIDEHIKKPQRQ